MKKPKTQEQEFEELYLAYWRYVYKYEVKHIEGFNPDIPNYKRDNFIEQLCEEGMSIKVREECLLK